VALPAGAADVKSAKRLMEEVISKVFNLEGRKKAAEGSS
jgi:hypothetical protein